MGDKEIKSVDDLERIKNSTEKTQESLVRVLAEGLKGTLQETVRDEVSAQFEKMNRREKLTKRLPLAGAEYNPQAPGATLDGQFKRFGEYLEVMSQHRNSNGATLSMEPRLKVVNEAAGADGGFLVPEEYRATLMMLALQQGYIRPVATVLPMPRGNLKFPIVRDVSHVTSVFGGVVAHWEAEGGNIAAGVTQPTFAQVGLLAKKLTGYTVAGNELLNDSAIALEALLMALFPEAIRFYEEEAFLNGSGAGEPQGIINSPATIAVSKEVGQPSATVKYENLVNMYSRMLPGSVQRAFWLYNPAVFPQLAQMSLAVGTGGSGVWITNVPGRTADGAPPTTILGRPAYPSEHCAALGTAGDIILIDPTYYVIGDTQELSIASSMHVNFANDQIVWRFIERIDGRPWLDSPLTPKYGTNTLSAFVTIENR